MTRKQKIKQVLNNLNDLNYANQRLIGFKQGFNTALDIINVEHLELVESAILTIKNKNVIIQFMNLENVNEYNNNIFNIKNHLTEYEFNTIKEAFNYVQM